LAKPTEYYCGKMGRNLVASVMLASSIQDRPEQDSCNKTMGTGSLFGKRWMWSCFINSQSPIPSCRDCNSRRKTNLIHGTSLHFTCGVCTDWEFDHPLLHMKLSSMPATFKYPTSLEPGSPPTPMGRSVGLREAVIFEPIQLAYSWMKQAVACCFYNYHTHCRGKHLGSTRGWTSFGWNKGLSSNCLQSCTLNASMWDSISSLSEKYSHLPTNKAMEFLESIIPAVWKQPNMELPCHLDAAFHMVFHGVLVNVVELVSRTLHSTDVRTPVAERITDMVAKLRDLHHPELPLLPFKNKQGDPFGMTSWMGSQKVAFSQILHFCFLCSSTVGREKFS
jgi:hypothetical protein